MRFPKIAFLLFLFCHWSSFAQDLSIEEQYDQCEREANEYLITKIFDFNKNTRYLDYPYSECGDNFFVRENSVNYDNAKIFYGTIESSIVKGLNQKYLGNESKLHFALLPILGVKAENIIFETSDHSYDGNFKLGVEIPILLFDYFNLGLDTFWSLMYYESVKNYYCIGVNVKSFFVKPLILEGSAYFHGTDDIYFQEYSAQMGVFVKSLNIFAGWKYLRGNCFYIGARRYF